MSEKSPTHRTDRSPRPANRYPGATRCKSRLRFPAHLDGTGPPCSVSSGSSHPGCFWRHCLLVRRGGPPGRFRGWGEDDGARRACGGATGRVVRGIAASIKGTAFTGIYPARDGPNVQASHKATSGACGPLLQVGRQTASLTWKDVWARPTTWKGLRGTDLPEQFCGVDLRPQAGSRIRDEPTT